MAEALSLHMTEEQSLRAEKERLEIANRQLAAEKELSQQLAQEKVSQAQQHKKLIRYVLAPNNDSIIIVTALELNLAGSYRRKSQH